MSINNMSPRKLNVLVYAGKYTILLSSELVLTYFKGTGSTEGAVRYALYTLRRHLLPNYAVETITEKVILEQPWTASCALLVFPGGADMGYCRSLDGKGNERIKQYVKRGGAYLGFCAGGYYGSSKCEFEVGDKQMEVVGKRELAFYPGICRGLAFKGFVYGSEAGARAAKMMVNKLAFKTADENLDNFRSYYNGGGVFVDAEKFKDQGVEMLAQYDENIAVDGGSRNERAAVVYCKVGEGHVILTGIHPEFVMTLRLLKISIADNRRFAAGDLDARNGGPDYAKVIEAVAGDDEKRMAFMKGLLGKLGLLVAEEVLTAPSLSALHISSLYNEETSKLLENIKKDAATSVGGVGYLKAEQDTFLLVQEEALSLDGLAKSLPSSDPHVEDLTKADPLASDPLDYSKIIKTMIFHEHAAPSHSDTPCFDHILFYESLMEYQSQGGTRAKEWGNILMYGETVTSTNTLLEKNQRLLNHIPNGFAATATTQVAGRGRGSNAWISPPRGQLILSVCFRHSLALNEKAPVVFVQYLAAIAIAEGIRTYDKGYADVPVKLKWPNDIYALDPTKPGKNEYVKIGGILVNSSYSEGSYNLVVGIGVNCANAAPTTSLNALRPKNVPEFSVEKCLARILTTFEDIYKRFCEMGFDRLLEERYYKLWLHTGQIVTLEAEGGVRARILGITRDWGLLKVEELGWEDKPTGKIFELQTDNNSFDFFKGLLRTKK